MPSNSNESLESLRQKLQPYLGAVTEAVILDVQALIQKEVIGARLDEAYQIGIKHEKGEYLPATYLIDRRDELVALNQANKESE